MKEARDSDAISCHVRPYLSHPTFVVASTVSSFMEQPQIVIIMNSLEHSKYICNILRKFGEVKLVNYQYDNWIQCCGELTVIISVFIGKAYDPSWWQCTYNKCIYRQGKLPIMMTVYMQLKHKHSMRTGFLQTARECILNTQWIRIWNATATNERKVPMIIYMAHYWACALITNIRTWKDASF